MNPLRFTRRNLLRGGLAATAAYPLLEARRVQGQTARARRVWSSSRRPNGTRNSLFWPTGTDSNYSLNTITSSLEVVQEQADVPEGHSPQRSASERPRSAAISARSTRAARAAMLTGRPLNSGTDFISFGNTTSGWGSGQSIDQYLVDTLAPNTTFPSFQVGVHVRDTQVRARIAYRASNQPIPPREGPARRVHGAVRRHDGRHRLDGWRDRSGARAPVGTKEERLRPHAGRIGSSQDDRRRGRFA